MHRMLSAVTVILLLLQFGADSVLSQLINDKEYRDILEALVAGHTKATWTSVDTLLRQTTPKLYSNLSEKVHGFRSNMLLVGPNTSSADMFVLQGLSKFVVPPVEVRIVTTTHRDVRSHHAAVFASGVVDSCRTRLAPIRASTPDRPDSS